MLFRMAGGITDEEIAAGNADFAALLASLTGKTMEEYKKEIAAKKRRLKTEIEAIPERIDERRRDVPEAEDWAALEEELRQKQEAVGAIKFANRIIKPLETVSYIILAGLTEKGNDINAITGRYRSVLEVKEELNTVKKHWIDKVNIDYCI